MNIYSKLDFIFERVFAEKNQKTIERYTLIFSMIGFIVHLFLILGNNYELFSFASGAELLQDPIAAIYTPFSIILVYEI